MKHKISSDDRCALIGKAIEIDLRNWITNEILTSNKLQNCLNEEFYKNLKNRFIFEKKREDEEVFENEIEDTDLIDFVDFGTAINILLKNKEILTVLSKNIFQEIKEDLNSVKIIRDAAIHGRMLLATQIDTIDDFIQKIKKFENIFDETLKKHLSISKYSEDDISDELYDDERESNHNLPKSDTAETGFIERRELNTKINRVMNNYPVISFIGDAGCGKTVLALKKASEFIGDSKFDVIWWHSFKTEKFSEGEVKKINLDINTSEKFLSSFQTEGLDPDPIKNLVKYLETFKVLLVLDNLETVLDHNFMSFLDQFAEAEHQSKIFITSRIPINRGDKVISVDAFKDNEAMDYFRRLANFLQLKDLQRTSSDKAIKNLIHSRNNNPLHIKLSLNAVADGIRLEEAFKPEKNLYNYCYMNVYKTFNKNSKSILELLYHLKRELNISDIIESLPEKDIPEKIELAVRDLIRKNFIRTDYKKSGTSYYILKKEVLPFIKENNFFDDQKRKKLIFQSLSEQSSAAAHIDINIDRIDELSEDWNSFLCRKTSDKKAVLDLRKISSALKTKEAILRKKAFKKERLDDFSIDKIKRIDVANDILLNQLKKTHRDFCEVYRTEGLIHSMNLNLVGTIESFEKAIELQPDYPNIYNYYSERLRVLQAIPESKKNAERTLKLFPNNTAAMMNLLLPKMYLEEFDETLENLLLEMEKLIDTGLPESRKRKIVMRIISYAVRQTEFLIKKREYEQAFSKVKDAFNQFNKFAKKHLIDYITVKRTVGKMRFPIIALIKTFRGSEKEKTLVDYLDMISVYYKKFPDPYDIKRKKILLGGEYSGKIWRDHKNHLKLPGGAYIVLRDAFVEEYGFVSHKIYIQEKNIPEFIKNNWEKKTGTELTFKAGKYFDEFRQRNYLVAIEPEEIIFKKKPSKKVS